jgi:hypothetical protein
MNTDTHLNRINISLYNKSIKIIKQELNKGRKRDLG